MKNLIKAIEVNQSEILNNFIADINKLEPNKESLKGWIYTDLVPKSKDTTKLSFDELKAYLIARKTKEIVKNTQERINKINTVANAGELIEIKISIEWKRSQMWGSNPKAEAWAYFTNKDGNRESARVESGSISGCGYDKQSTAVANCLNQINEVLKPLYLLKDQTINKDLHNNKIFGYGAGSSTLPYIAPGVGVSCYNSIFEKIGFEFKTIASGKNYDVYTITKK